MEDGITMDWKRSPSPLPMLVPKAALQMESASHSLSHVNQKSSLIDGEYSLCDTSSNRVLASNKVFL
jgi:hypothetical protein